MNREHTDRSGSGAIEGVGSWPDAGSRRLQDRLVGATAVLGKKWHLTIIHVLSIAGPLGFSDLEGRIDGISAKVLSDSLGELESKGLVDRTVLSERPVRVEYSLTADGDRFRPIITTIRDDFDDFDWIDADSNR